MKEIIIIVEIFKGQEKSGNSHYNLTIDGRPKGSLSKNRVLELIDKGIQEALKKG